MKKSAIGAEAQSLWDERPRQRADEAGLALSGAVDGLSGERLRVPGLAYAGEAAFIMIAMTVSALSLQHDAGGRIQAWRPFVTEYSAGLMILFASPGVGALTERTPVGRGRWLGFIGVHLVASIAFCAVVVTGFVLIRKAIFAAIGQGYYFGTGWEFIYEFRKLALAYCGMAAIFYLTARLNGAPPVPTVAPPREATFDIRDGTKLIRARVSEIVCARAAGNYVEVRLAGGGRPLKRSTLAGVERTLGSHGFVRSHRSWLINPAHVRALEPEGSGDWVVSLEDGSKAPLSRRFPAALEAVRNPQPPKRFL